MPKRPDPVVTWNRVVKSLQETKKAWEAHKEVMSERPNLDLLSGEAQKRLKFAFHKSSRFEKFLRAAMDLWQLWGGMDTLEIVEELIEPKQKKKEKE